MTDKKKKTKRKYTDRKREYDLEYHKQHIRQFNFKLSENVDSDLIKIYEEMPDKIGFIRDALRRYAEENNIKTGEQ